MYYRQYLLLLTSAVVLDNLVNSASTRSTKIDFLRETFKHDFYKRWLDVWEEEA